MSTEYVVPQLGQGSVFGDEEVEAVGELLRSGAHLSDGHHREAFEEEFAGFLGARHALAVPSCTVALELATHLIGLEPGDEVIATPLTYQATISSLLARPVEVRFCDVDPDSLCLDPQKLESLVTDRTRAIYVTHYGGLVCDMDAIMEVAQEREIVVIEDCAHAHGAEYRDSKPGTLGHIGCWSFQSLKNMSTLGQGGMITLNDDRWAEVLGRMRALEPDADFVERASPRRFGPHPVPEEARPVRHDKNAHTHDCVAIRAPGTNAIMGEPAALVGRIQLGKLPAFIERRREIVERLNTALASMPGIRVQSEPDGYRHAYHLYSFFVDPKAGINRDEVASQLEEAGIEIILRYFPLHLLPEWRFRGGEYGTCPEAERVFFEELINFPIYPTMSDRQVDYMIKQVKQAAKRSVEDVTAHKSGRTLIERELSRARES